MGETEKRRIRELAFSPHPRVSVSFKSLAGATTGFAAGGAGCGTCKRFSKACCTKDRELLLYFFRAALRARDLLFSEDELLKVLTAVQAFVFIYWHIPTL